MDTVKRLLLVMTAAFALMMGWGSAAMAQNNAPSLKIVGNNANMFEGKTFFGGTWYGVDAKDVCRSQYLGRLVVAGTLDPSDAASLMCWTPVSTTQNTERTVTIGSENTLTVAHSGSVEYRALGGLDIYKWCNWKHPGTGATSVFNTATTWACIR